MEGLHAASARDPTAFRLEGRYPVYVISAKVPSGTGQGQGSHWAVRHYARGGRFVSVLLGDRYLLSSRVRPFHEAEASEAARDRGIPTPRVVAAAMYRKGLFYRADLVTEFIPNAEDLVRVIFDPRKKGAGGAVERLQALESAGHLLRTMADAGLHHRDLHAGNILMEWKGAAPRAHLLDLDRCEVKPLQETLSPLPMLHRLKRSLLKWERETRLSLSEREWSALEKATRE